MKRLLKKFTEAEQITNKLESDPGNREELQKAADCATQHIRIFLAQSTNKEVADIGKVCAFCKLHKEGKCKNFDWLKNLDLILSQSTIKLSVCDAGKTNYK